MLCRHGRLGRRVLGTRRLSTGQELLKKLREAARDAGGDPLEVYQPWMLTDSLQQSLMLLHQASGDASLAVLGAALGTRLLSLPWNWRSLQRRCDAMALMPVYQELAKAYNEQRQGGTEADLRRAGDRVKEFTEETRFFPLQGLGYQLGFVVPIGLTYFGALYGIMQHPDAFRDFATAPSLWLDSLLLPDPLGVLPCLSALALLGNAEVNATPPKPGQEETAKYFQLVIRGALLTFAKSWGRPSSLDMCHGLRAVCPQQPSSSSLRTASTLRH
ncbi:unnamed protein product [Effrenium voratum]|nr:unnamed protein product [Effrenium voratum]